MEKYLKIFIIFTFLTFIILIGVIGAFIFVFDMPLVGRILQVLGAWTSTFVFFAMFNKIYPKDNLRQYILRQFKGKISLSVIVSIILFFIVILLGNVFFISLTKDIMLSTLVVSSFSTLVSSFLMCFIKGPLGEEIGWRAFFLTELEKKYGLLKAAIITGLLWSFWHFPLILVSGDSLNVMIIQFICNTLAFIGLTLIMAILYNDSKNLVVPILIHQFFNYSLSIIKDDTVASTIGITICTCIFAILCLIIYVKKTNHHSQSKL